METTGKILVYSFSGCVCLHSYNHNCHCKNTNVKLIIIFIALDTVDSFHKHNFQKLDDITLSTNLYLLLCYLILSLIYKITDWDVLYHHHF